jgi:hypothetical protein
VVNTGKVEFLAAQGHVKTFPGAAESWLITKALIVLYFPPQKTKMSPKITLPFNTGRSICRVDFVSLSLL